MVEYVVKMELLTIHAAPIANEFVVSEDANDERELLIPLMLPQLWSMAEAAEAAVANASENEVAMKLPFKP